MAMHPSREEPKPCTIVLSSGEAITLDDAYFRRQDAAARARLAAPQLSDEELERCRAAHPDEAWLWTRGTQDAIRQTDERQVSGTRGTIYTSDEALQAALDELDAGDADL